MTNIIYIDDLNYCINNKDKENEEIVLVCNVNLDELFNLYDKIENMCI